MKLIALLLLAAAAGAAGAQQPAEPAVAEPPEAQPPAAQPQPAPLSTAQPYGERADVQAFIGQMVERHGFVAGDLRTVFAKVERVDTALRSMETPAERLAWPEYRAQFVNELRIARGLEFWKANGKALRRAAHDYGVPAQIIVAIIGVETNYGRNMGRWRVVDALTTLAFDYPPRADYFRAELEQYLLLTRDAGLDVFALRGSYAGAIGIPQFMPRSFRRYAVDFNADGVIDLRESADDAIGSIANFLRQHGWQPGQPVLYRARAQSDAARALVATAAQPTRTIGELKAAGVQIRGRAEPEARAALISLGGDLRVGLQNFYVITRYNRSLLYAAAVSDLAGALAGRVQSAGK